MMLPNVGCGGGEPEAPPPEVQTNTDELAPPSVEMPGDESEAGSDTAQPEGSQSH